MYAHPEDAVDFFDYLGQAEWYKSIQRSLMHWVGVRDMDEVLDAGCGAGWLGIQIASRVESMTCLDISESMLARSERNAKKHRMNNMKCVRGDLYDIPSLANQYSLVFCMNVMFVLDDMERALAELLRVCRVGGSIVFLNPSLNLTPMSAQTYCQTYELHGFELESMVSWAVAYESTQSESYAQFQRVISSLDAHTVEQEFILDNMAVITKVTKVVG